MNARRSALVSACALALVPAIAGSAEVEAEAEAEAVESVAVDTRDADPPQVAASVREA